MEQIIGFFIQKLSSEKITFYICFIFLFQVSEGIAQDAKERQMLGSKSMNKMKILALGDSYTIGEDVPQSESWPFLLKGKLEANGRRVDLIVIAKTGWTTGELNSAIIERKLDADYDLTFLLIGVNNQYRGYSLEDYKEGFRELLRKAKSYSKTNNACVLSIPDWSCTPFAVGRDIDKISSEIEAFNQANIAIAEKENVIYVDITEISKRSRSDGRYTAGDGLHPSGFQYEKWVEKIVPAIKGILNH